MKEFTIDLTQELVDYAQRLGYEIDTRVYLIDRIFDMHKNDTDTRLFDSMPFKKYQRELSEIKTEYDLAVREIGEKIKDIVYKKMGRDDINFDWEIADFNALKATITVTEDGIEKV